MLVRSVVEHQFNEHLHAALMGGVQKLLEILQTSVVRMDIRIIRDIVSVVAQRRRIEWQQPQAGNAEVLKVIKLADQAGKIADAVIITVGKSTNMEFIDNRILVPERIG